MNSKQYGVYDTKDNAVLIFFGNRKEIKERLKVSDDVVYRAIKYHQRINSRFAVRKVK